MVYRKSQNKRLVWWFFMIALFVVTVGVVSRKGPLEKEFSALKVSTAPIDLKIDEARIARERKLEDEIESCKFQFDEIKNEIRDARLLSRQRSQLKRLLRKLQDEEKGAKKKLRELRLAPEAEWEHLADHLEADLNQIKERAKAPLNHTSR